MTVKQKVIASINSLPSKIDFEEIQYRLYVMSKIEKSRESIKEGLVGQEEMEREFSK